MNSTLQRDIIQTALAVTEQFLGGFDELIYAFITFVCIRYITELLSAIVEKKLSNEIGLYGFIKRVFVFLLIGAANILDDVVGIGGIARTITITFFMYIEGISMLENARRINLPVPPKLKEILTLLLNHKGN